MTKVQNWFGHEILQDMTWQEFETLVGEVFRRKGHSVQENGPDGDVDLVQPEAQFNQYYWKTS